MSKKPVHDHFNLGGSNRLLTLAEAAAILNVAPRSLRDYRKSWGIPAFKVGRELRLPPERDLIAWIDRRAA